MIPKNHPSSFRDRSGFIFEECGQIFRRINHSYRNHYHQLMDSGLYDSLIEAELLIAHREVSLWEDQEHDYAVIEPELIPFISYPYEWSFSQLKDAALTTLKIQQISLKYGMTLKDASAYNIQFRHGKPIFIDTLSWEIYEQGMPWQGYRQFCQHFFAPLALMSWVDIRLGQLSRTHIDGVPLDLASRLLPKRSYFSVPILLHLHLHAKAQSYYADRPSARCARVDHNNLHGIVDNLSAGIECLRWKKENSEWSDYYNETNYSEDALKLKEKLVEKFLESIPCKLGSCWDLGANTGRFSRSISKYEIPTISWDGDHAAVEENYLQVKKQKERNILPLLQDLCNPSPSIGWESCERDSLLQRSSADLVLSLALIHHLAIGNNVPFSILANFFHRLCQWLIIEFVPKEDSQVERLLATRKDNFSNYNQNNFEIEFAKYFSVERRQYIEGTMRTLYLMKKVT